MADRPTPKLMADRLIVALDVPSVDQARALTDRQDPVVNFYKIGMWLFYAPGAERLIDDLIRRGKKIFLDCKMYDIGETVKQGVARATDRGVSIITVHGDPEIMQAAVAGKGGSAETRIFAISVLTSMNDASLAALGYRLAMKDLIDLRVKLASECGCDGVIASASDDPNGLRQVAGNPRLLVGTPGIRPAGSAVDDHKRPGTPAQAIARGADYLVVGRPIVQQPDPVAAARAIIAEMENGTA